VHLLLSKAALHALVAATALTVPACCGVAAVSAGGGDCSVPGSSKLSFEQLTRLALPAQLQLELLEVLVMLAEAPGSDLMLPK
jgi:hypothetical protein